MEAAGIEPALKIFNRRPCVTGEDTLAWASVRKMSLEGLVALSPLVTIPVTLARPGSTPKTLRATIDPATSAK